MKIIISFKQEPLSWFLVACCTFAVGVFPLVYKKLFDASNNVLTVIILLFFFSFLFNLIASALPLLRSAKILPIKIKSNILSYLIILALLTIFGNITFLLAIQNLSPGIAQLVQRSELIFVLYLSWIFFAEKVTFGLNLSVLIILIGMYFLKTQENSHQIFQSFIPILWAIASGLAFALMQLILQVAVRKHHPAIVNMMRLLITMIILFLYPPSWKILHTITIDILFWGIIAAFLGPFFARLCYSYACKKISVSKIVLVTPVAPVITVILQWCLLNITITTSEIIGSIIILCGMYAAIKFR